MKTLALILLIPSLSLAQTMYKCPDANGVTKFQQLPCDGGNEVSIKPLSNGKGSGTGRELEYYKTMKAEQERINAEEEERIAQANNKKALERVIKEKGIVNGKSYKDRSDRCNASGVELTNCLNDVLSK